MRRLSLVLAGLVGLGITTGGCIGVYGTIRVVHVSEDGTPVGAGQVADGKVAVPAAVPEQPKTSAAAPAAKVPDAPALAVPEKKDPVAEVKAEAKPVAKAETKAPARRVVASLNLPATRDTRLTHHSAEVGMNTGKSNRLRVVGIQRKGAELVAIDFDRAGLRKFVDKHAGQTFEGKLVLNVREVQGGAGKIEVCTLDSATDWNEGTSDLTKAKPGEVTALEAQSGTAKWKTTEGKEVENAKALIYSDGKITTLLNSQGVNVEAGAGEVQISLDEAFILHLATNAACRGVILFHREQDSKIDFFSRDQNKKQPRLEISTR